MSRTIAFAAIAALLLPAAAGAETAAGSDRVDVAFEELAQGMTDQAVVQLLAQREVETDDPAVLINLGTAYARQGKVEEARAMFLAAMNSANRYELELADGSWVDSRKAARLALKGLAANPAS